MLQWVCHHEYATIKKYFFSVARKFDSELAIRMSFGSEFQMFGASIQNTCLAVSVRVHGTERRGASGDRRDHVVTWRCRSSSVYSWTDSYCVCNKDAVKMILVVFWQDVALLGLASMLYQSSMVDEAMLVTILALDNSPEVVAIHFMLANLYAAKVCHMQSRVLILFSVIC